jgi:hypothetical protein
MQYSKKDLTFIIYNNRSPKLVERFILDKNLDINKYKLIKIENIISTVKDKYTDNTKDLLFNLKDINLDGKDLIYGLNDINALKNDILKLKGIFSDREIIFLTERGLYHISDNFISLDKVIENYLNFDSLGISIHPTLKNILDDGNNGGIIIPLFEKDMLVNIAVRRIGVSNNEKNKTLKYSLACPDIDIWGIEDIKKGDEIWITEGIFDMYALKENGFKAISVSSPHWSSIQLYRLLEKKPSIVNIFSDNDYTGISSSFVMADFLDEFSINTKVYMSKFSKDASEHFFEKKLSMESVINIENNNFYTNKQNLFSYTDYLKNRNFK